MGVRLGLQWKVNPGHLLSAGFGVHSRKESMTLYTGSITIHDRAVIQRKYVPGYHYGYHWWISDHNFYTAVGYGGQRITVFPDLDLVVVFTNGLDETDDLQRATPDRLIETYILPSIL